MYTYTFSSFAPNIKLTKYAALKTNFTHTIKRFCRYHLPMQYISKVLGISDNWICTRMVKQYLYSRWEATCSYSKWWSCCARDIFINKVVVDLVYFFVLFVSGTFVILQHGRMLFPDKHVSLYFYNILYMLWCFKLCLFWGKLIIEVK